MGPRLDPGDRTGGAVESEHPLLGPPSSQRPGQSAADRPGGDQGPT